MCVFFLSHPSTIIGNVCQWLTDWPSHSLTNSHLVNLMPVNYDATFNLLQIWELTFGPKTKLFSDFEHKGWSRFWSWSSGMILKLEFVQYFAVDVLWRLWSWILVEILKLGLVKILSFKFSGDVIKICIWTCDMTSKVTLAIWTQPSGPLCLWQCF